MVYNEQGWGTMGRKRPLTRRDPREARLLVAGRIRLWRHYAELSQTQLAQACGVSRSTVQRWEDERSESGPTVAQVISAAQAAGEKPADVLVFMGGGGLRG